MINSASNETLKDAEIETIVTNIEKSSLTEGKHDMLIIAITDITTKMYNYFEWSDEVRAKREPSSRNEYIK